MDRNRQLLEPLVKNCPSTVTSTNLKFVNIILGGPKGFKFNYESKTTNKSSTRFSKISARREEEHSLSSIMARVSSLGYKQALANLSKTVNASVIISGESSNVPLLLSETREYATIYKPKPSPKIFKANTSDERLELYNFALQYFSILPKFENNRETIFNIMTELNKSSNPPKLRVMRNALIYELQSRRYWSVSQILTCLLHLKIKLTEYFDNAQNLNGATQIDEKKLNAIISYGLRDITVNSMNDSSCLAVERLVNERRRYNNSK